MIADGKKPTPGAITAKMRRLFPSSDSDSTGSKETATKRTNTLLSRVSGVRVPEGLKHGELELETADMLVRTGSDVQVPEILPELGAKNLDELINGVVRQFDCPLWSSGRTIEGQFKRAGRQADKLVLDIRRSGFDDKEACDDARRRLAGETKIENLMVMTHDDAVRRIFKKQPRDRLQEEERQPAHH